MPIGVFAQRNEPGKAGPPSRNTPPAVFSRRIGPEADAFLRPAPERVGVGFDFSRIAILPPGPASVQRACRCGGRCAACREGGKAPAIVRDALQSPGESLDADARAFMEPRFGHDFGKVRVHSGSLAAESARAIGARAYTVGSHIVFGGEAPSFASEEGRRLLAHELAHVVQQRDSDAGGELKLGPVGGVFEDQAHRAAHAVGAGNDASGLSAGSASAVVQRQAVAAEPVAEGSILPETDPLYPVPADNSYEAMYERSQLYGATQRLRSLAARPIMILVPGGAPPDFVTELRPTQAALKTGQIVTVQYSSFHVLDFLEYWGEHAPDDAALALLIQTYIPDLAPSKNPFAVTPTAPIAEIDPDLDPGGKERLAALIRGIQKRKTKAKAKPKPEPAPQPQPQPQTAAKPKTKRKRPQHCSDSPTEEPLPIKWPSFLPVPEDVHNLVRTPGTVRELEAMGDRGRVQARMNEEIRRARYGRHLQPPPKPCDPAVLRDESRWNAPYDAHHIHPLFLGGFDVRSNLCALQADLHQKGHPALNNQTEFLESDYLPRGICSGFLTHHPAYQRYMIVGEK